MKIKDILQLSWLNIKSSKFKNIIFVSVIAIFMTIIMCIFSGRNSFLKFVDDNMNGDFEFRLIGVMTNNYNNQELKENLEKMNIKHVTNVFKDSNAFYQLVNFGDDSFSKIDLYGNYKGINYTIDSGREIKNDNEMICSSKFYPGNWTEVHNDDDFVNMKEHLNEEFKISFDKYYIIDNNNRELIKSYEYKLKLVGTFDVNKDLTGYDVCYVSTHFFEKISEENTSIYKDEEAINEFENQVFVLVDKYKNIDSVTKKLTDSGYQTQLYAELDLSFFTTVEFVINIITIIITIISIVCVYLFIKNILEENCKNIALYKLLGYNDKNINLIFSSQYVINTSIALIISIVLSNIIKIIISSILALDPNFSVLNIYIYYGHSIVYFIFVITIILISTNYLFKNKFNYIQPIKLMEDKL